MRAAAPSAETLRGMVGYHDLIADLPRSGCPICHGAHRAAWRYLDGLLWESVTDGGVRLALRRSHGYCRDHAFMLLRVATEHVGTHGLAILVEDLLRHVAADAELEGAMKRAHRPGPLAPEATCGACAVARHTEETYVKILAVAPEGTEPYERIRRANRGICVPHVAFGMAILTAPDERKRLAETFRHGVDELSEELRGFVRKQDYRYHDERISDAEATSWRRGTYRLVGEPLPVRKPVR